MREVGLALGTVGLICSLPMLWRLRSALHGTTLLTAWNWGAVGMGLWSLAWFLTLLFPIVTAGIADQLWYAAALVLLCSTVAVLGAKRPGTRVWSWFVLAPLLLVLGWPALFAWRAGGLPERLFLSREAALTDAFVCLMGVGNYFRTRFAIPALLFGGGVLAVVASVAALRWTWLPDPTACRIGATLCLAAAVGFAGLRRGPERRQLAPLDRLWLDFRDHFGIVWARRIQDRFNDVAQKSHWPARLELEGLHWQADSAAGDNGMPGPADTALLQPGAGPSPEATFRWLLRRFVDPDWIDRRLSPPEKK